MMDASTSLARHSHPALAPAGMIFDALDISVEPSAVVVMASGIRYADPDGLDDFGGLDAAFDLFEAAGFNCEQFRSVDAGPFLDAARREHALAERRWRATPFYSLHPECDPVSGATTVRPVALSEFGDTTVRITSTFADRTASYEDLLRGESSLWGYAAPVPSLRAILAPARYDLAARARRSLRLLFLRMATARDGLSRLESFVSSRPLREKTQAYRRGMAAMGADDDSFHRSVLVAAIESYGTATVPDETHAGFARSAALHLEFLDGADAALAEIARVERAALDAHARGVAGRVCS
ncbi:hypothetical protein [uncultured Microbacterium sp.]|uniref:hypothetical protein n=2 Tax=uncultured Microbacterium sp. TaxID=191216 RepID=UPI0025CEA88D|nr:hypothetical protein [uncultured Microbacterium sp.]